MSNKAETETKGAMATKKTSVVLVGCGCPLRSMGWYHGMQLLDGRVKYAELKYVVEPWYFSEQAKGTPGYKEFHDWAKEVEAKHGVQFFGTVKEVPTSSDEIRLGIISARTADNPELMNDCLDIGCKAIYLEKPGAPTVDELEQMRDKAKAAGVKVFMGFNKNVSSYLTLSQEYAKTAGKCDVTFLHNNNYQNTETELAECFERNAEGMLKNMAIHELAILVTFYGVTVDSIEKVEANKEFSSCKTLKGPSSGKDFTDFDKLKFKIVTKGGIEVNVAADRCGGDDSVGIITDASSGKDLARYTMPDNDTVAAIDTLKAKYGNAMPYFFAQDPDYLKLKALVAQNCVDDSPTDGVATIDVAVETLKVAEYLTPILQKQFQ